MQFQSTIPNSTKCSVTVNPEPRQSPSELGICEFHAIERWHGWKLVGAWAGMILGSWAVFYALGVALFELLLWWKP